MSKYVNSFCSYYSCILQHLSLATALILMLFLIKVVASNLVDLMRFVPQYVPWVGRQRPSLSSIITGGDPLLEPSGSNQTVSIFNSSTNHGDIGLFFGAEWSQPCQTFLPLLRTAYETLQAKHKNNSIAKTEIIFVSLDQSEAEFDRYRKEVPFPALPFNDRRRALLQVGMNIRSVPSLGTATCI
jgi:nucleoredoxin